MNRRGGIEISAVTVEEAVEFALDQLGLERDQVDVEVLRAPDEPDEHGYVSDEALVYVEPLEAHAPAPTAAPAPEPALQSPAVVVAPEAPRRAARQRRHSSQGKRASLSPGDRARAAQAGQETLSDLLHHVGVIASCQAEPSSVTTADDTAPVLLTVEGEELGVLIGRRGESLAAMEYILNLMVQKQIGVWPSLQVDVAGYRRRREETLDGLARRMARRVSETQQPYTFEPMSPRERRILHLAIQEDDRVTTESTGEGDERRVVIYPAE